MGQNTAERSSPRLRRPEQVPNPKPELHDPVAWRQSWLDKRERLSQEEPWTFQRWNTDDPACA